MADVSIAIIPNPSVDDVESPSPSPNYEANARSVPKITMRVLASVMLISGCIAGLHVSISRDFTRGALTSASALKDEIARAAFAGWSKLPGLRDFQSIMQDMSWESTKATADTIKIFTAETAELAWEKAELAWDSISKKTDDSDHLKNNSEENGFVRALGGIGEFLHLGDRKGKQVGRPNVRRNARQEQQKKEKKKRGDQAHRRLKAVDSKNEIGNNESATAGNAEAEISWLSSLSDSPLASAILTLAGVVFLIASFISSSDSRRLNRLAASYEGRNTIVDEEEAEILEFYEKEMEAESFDRVLSFDVEDGHARLDNVFEHVEKAVGSRPSALSDGSMQLLKRDSGDSYYARVLQDIEALDCEDVAECKQDECVENFVCEARCEGEPEQSISDQDACESFNTPNEILDVSQEQKEDELNESNNKGGHQNLSESSSNSSISSLTSDNDSDDIEASISYSFGSEAEENETPSTSALAESASPQMWISSPVPTQPLRSLSMSDAECTISETADTPLIHNTSNDRKSSLVKNPRPQFERRVSFNPEVSVKEIPRRQMASISSEKYLYFMLLTVGIAIAFFSLLPAHPSLSPASSMSRQEIINRADSLLSSQWDVEL